MPLQFHFSISADKKGFKLTSTPGNRNNVKYIDNYVEYINTFINTFTMCQKKTPDHFIIVWSFPFMI